MVGRDMAHRYPERSPHIGEVMLEVNDWTAHHPQHPERRVVKGVNMTVRRGEVVGIAGLMGGPLAAVSKLQAAGLDMDQIKVLGKETLGYAKEQAGEDLVRDVASSIPGISGYL